ncbi:hypothetical protein EV683_1441 [Crenobacter luteus]|nr:hypothetical protein EV683_1441 [Crenobacter luteus]
MDFEMAGVLILAFSQAKLAMRIPAQEVSTDAGIFLRSGRYRT